MNAHLLFYVFLCMSVCMPSEAESFIENYKSYMRAHYRKFHRLAERHSDGSIRASDSLIFIPTLTIREDINKKWIYNLVEINGEERLVSPSGNEKYASWDTFYYKKRKPDEFILYANGQCKKMYIDGWIGKVKYSDATNSLKKELMEMVTEYKPDGIFSVCDIPGWFFIIGENIAFIQSVYCPEQDDFKLLYHENSLDYVKLYFSDPTFMPITAKQEVK